MAPPDESDIYDTGDIAMAHEDCRRGFVTQYEGINIGASGSQGGT